jgi:ABC transporter
MVPGTGPGPGDQGHDYVAIRGPCGDGRRHPAAEQRMTRVGETSLSAGERQLVALGRLALLDPAVVILDEATAQLEPEMEWIVTSALRTLAEGRTVITIAHRLDTTRVADRVVVLDAGRVVEDGSPEELMVAGGRYAALWSAWTGGADGTGPVTASAQAPASASCWPSRTDLTGVPSPDLDRRCLAGAGQPTVSVARHSLLAGGHVIASPQVSRWAPVRIGRLRVRGSGR